MARRTKLTKETQARICDLIESGNTVAVAAQAAGITEQTFYNWKRRGEAAEERQRVGEKLTATERSYLSFFEAIKRAEAVSHAAAVAQIRKAGDKQWQALAWWLERKFPEQWGRRDTTKIEATVRQKEVKPEELSDEELALLLQGGGEE